MSVQTTLHAVSPLESGRPFPLGATLDDSGCNFAVYSPGATAVTLCLFDEQERETRQVSMASRTGHTWHVRVPDVRAGQLYGLRADGPFAPHEGLYFNAHKLLIDPYALALSRPCEYHPSLRTLAEPEREPLVPTPDNHDSSRAIPKGVVVDPSDFDWQGDQRPETPWQQTVIYEAHVKGLTRQHPDVPEAHQGTYLGMAHPSIINHLQALGVTAVQLMPVHAIMPEPRLCDLALTNYWGYNSASWFAPDPRYAYRDSVNELKTLVRALHKAGIEVILDVVYNHTAEADARGTTLSLKGLTASESYRFGTDGSDFINDTGCGNTVNIESLSMLTLIMDSLRYWTEHYHIDGFRFDLAATLGREHNAFRTQAAFFKAVAQDPALSRVKLIAEPWDIGPGGYQLGHFPDTWYECNDRFRDTVRGFWRGDAGLLPDFCTRMMGSRDLLQKGDRAFSTSLNYVTYHDGFTLEDLVSYERRHNDANLENNQDGHGHNLSANYGAEGPVSDPAILAVRDRQKRNMLTTLLLSQGAVHLLGGDELGRTQQGNNNAYCQDNALSWFDWSSKNNDLYLFIQRLTRLRASSTLFHDLVFSNDELTEGPAQSDAVHWFNRSGHRMSIADWHNTENQVIGLLLSPAVRNLETDLNDCDEYFLWLINAGTESVRYQLPALGINRWNCLLDTNQVTGEPDRQTVSAREITLPARSQILLGK